jgi:glycosyltransferase AglI
MCDVRDNTSIRFKRKPSTAFMSVIIPVYKDAGGLQDTLISLAHQTVPESEYEIIVSNDGGDESVSNVCRSFTKVRELKISPNGGSYNARNRALEESRGEFIAFVDADISIPAHWLEKGRNEMKYADYVGGPVIIDNSKITDPAHLYERYYGFPTEKFFYEEHFCVTANLFVRRSVIEEIGGFDGRLKSGGDYEFGNRVFLSGKYRQRYSKVISVLHPPRGFKKLVRKKVRQHKGRILMRRYYPDRYNYKKPSLINLLFSLILPPYPSAVDKLFNRGDKFSKIDIYLFVWRFKFILNVKLFNLYLKNYFDMN